MFFNFLTMNIDIDGQDSFLNLAFYLTMTIDDTDEDGFITEYK